MTSSPATPTKPAPQPLRVIGWPAFSNRRVQPYNTLLYTHLRELGVEVEEYTARRALSGRASILHLHWSPQSRVTHPRLVNAAARSAALLALLDGARARGARVVWTAHDVTPRRGHFFEPAFWRALGRRLDGVISLSDAAVEQVREWYPGLARVPAFVVPHGHYRDAYPRALTRAEARERLAIGPDAPTVAFVGQIRAYKNVPLLIESFAGIGDPSAVLLVAGMMKLGDGGERVRRAAAADPRVRLTARLVTDEEMQLYLGAADLVVLPYERILNSGSALLALSFDRPVLVPHTGSLVELAGEVGPEWVRTFHGPLDAPTLHSALEWAMSTARPPRPPLDAHDWRRVAALTLDAYRAVLANGTRRPTPPGS